MGRLRRALKKVTIQAGAMSEGLLELQSLLLRAEEELAKERIFNTGSGAQKRDLVDLEQLEASIYSITKKAEAVQEQVRGLEARLKASP